MKITLLYNEAEVLGEIANGSEQAFSVLFHKYRDKIFSVAYRLTESTFVAEEVVQDVFLKLWLRRTTLIEIHDFEDYLFIMARNHVFSALKRGARQRNLSDDLALQLPSSENSIYENIYSQEYDQIIKKAIAGLSSQQRQIFLLSKEQEMKREEIAQLLQISPETVKTHLARAIRHIRASIVLKIDILGSWILFIFLN